MPSNAKITAWSYSRWTMYEECPYKAHLKINLKMKEPPNTAMDRGSDIHKMAENYAKGTLTKIPAELKPLKAQFAEVRKVEGIRTEMEAAFTASWEPCDWFDKNTWVRIKIDLLIPPTKKSNVVRIVDHKTGRFKPGNYEPQLELYAIPALIQYPTADYVSPELWFTDHGIVYPRAEDKSAIYRPKDLPALKKLWTSRVKPMLSDTKFAPRPGNYCRWCAFSKAKGGPCKF